MGYSNCYASDDDDYDEETAALSATVSGLIGGAVALVTLTAAAMWWRSRAAQIRDAKQKMNSQVFYVYEKAEPSESQWPKAPPSRQLTKTGKSGSRKEPDYTDV